MVGERMFEHHQQGMGTWITEWIIKKIGHRLAKWFGRRIIEWITKWNS